jgi:hypothetical protein
MDQTAREKSRLASKAYREKNKEEYRAKNRERYYRDKAKKEAELNSTYDLAKYPEEERKKIVKLIKDISIMKAKYPQLLPK